MPRHESNKKHDNANALNKALIDDLKNKGLIQTSIVETAFREVLRHIFLPGTPLEEAYSDRAISAKQDQSGQWLSSSSQPAMMAIMLEQLNLKPGHKVLEVGAGTGYNAALMDHIVGDEGQIVSIEIDEDLVDSARERLALAGFEDVQVVCTDGGYGYPDASPYDRIILTVGAPDVTPAWWNQLKPDGRLVLPLILKGSMKSIAFKQVKDHLESISVHDCGFISLRGDFASPPSNRIQLGPDPGLYVQLMDGIPIDSDRVYDLLTGGSKDWPAGVDVTAWDVLHGNLWTWLALHERQICKLNAEDDMVERNIVPPLIGIENRQKSSSTAVVLDKMGLAALMRPPGQSLPMVTIEKLYTPDSPAAQPFPLFVRQFGLNESIAQRLTALIYSWDTAGRPSSDGMRIRAYPKDVGYVPSNGEFMIEKQWTKLVIDWPAMDS